MPRTFKRGLGRVVDVDEEDAVVLELPENDRVGAEEEFDGFVGFVRGSG